MPQNTSPQGLWDRVTNRNLNGLVRCCAVHRIGPFWVGRSARVACTNGTDIRAGKPPGLKSRSQNKMSLSFGVNTAVKSVVLAGRALLESQANVGDGEMVSGAATGFPTLRRAILSHSHQARVIR